MHENTSDQAWHGIRCWCGNTTLAPFSTAYLYCACCQTLVSRHWPEEDVTHVLDDARDLYGKNYWFAHQENDLGLPNVIARARTDIPERCLYWLRTLLKYKLPPAKVLELGSAHGGFVALLQWAGFEAMGVEISPWVVDFARQTFDVPMLQGPVEEQHMEPGTLDIIALMDVLEHLPDPVSTIQHCLRLLKPGGILVMQTPCLPAGKTYEEMVAERHSFLEMLLSKEHLYLFSQHSICEFFRRMGINYVEFEPAIFAHYDMFCIASRVPLTVYPSDRLSKALSTTVHGRMIQALLDIDDQHHDVQQRYADVQQCYAASEADRAARLRVIEQQGEALAQAQAQVHHWLQESQCLTARVQELATEQATLQQHLEAAEADRVARLRVIKQQGEALARAQAQVHHWLQESQCLTARVQELATEQATLQQQFESVQRVVETIAHTRVYRLLRLLGRWRFME